jgi:hypothetical protein
MWAVNCSNKNAKQPPILSRLVLPNSPPPTHIPSVQASKSLQALVHSSNNTIANSSNTADQTMTIILRTTKRMREARRSTSTIIMLISSNSISSTSRPITRTHIPINAMGWARRGEVDTVSVIRGTIWDTPRTNGVSEAIEDSGMRMRMMEGEVRSCGDEHRPLMVMCMSICRCTLAVNRRECSICTRSICAMKLFLCLNAVRFCGSIAYNPRDIPTAMIEKRDEIGKHVRSEFRASGFDVTSGSEQGWRTSNKHPLPSELHNVP